MAKVTFQYLMDDVCGKENKYHQQENLEFVNLMLLGSEATNAKDDADLSEELDTFKDNTKMSNRQQGKALKLRLIFRVRLYSDNSQHVRRKYRRTTNFIVPKNLT